MNTLCALLLITLPPPLCCTALVPQVCVERAAKAVRRLRLEREKRAAAERSERLEAGRTPGGRAAVRAFPGNLSTAIAPPPHLPPCGSPRCCCVCPCRLLAYRRRPAGGRHQRRAGCGQRGRRRRAGRDERGCRAPDPGGGALPAGALRAPRVGGCAACCMLHAGQAQCGAATAQPDGPCTRIPPHPLLLVSRLPALPPTTPTPHPPAAVCHNRALLASDARLRASALLALTKLMVVDAGFCEANLQLLFTLLQNRCAVLGPGSSGCKRGAAAHGGAAPLPNPCCCHPMPTSPSTACPLPPCRPCPPPAATPLPPPPAASPCRPAGRWRRACAPI